jgi:hypothetical protein
MSLILAFVCTVGDVDSANRFCVRTIQTVDVSWPLMSNSRRRCSRTVSGFTCCVSVGLFFDRRKVLFEIQHLRRLI